MSKPKNIAIVGATGAVGVEMMRCLDERKFPVGELRLLASARSAGKVMKFKGQDIVIQELTEQSFAGIDIALFSAGGDISRKYATAAVAAGAVVVDNSSAFRQDPTVPLVVPEINAADVKNHQGILANPNCTTAITLMALHPLHQAFGVTRVIASSYQAVSGTGAQAIEELAAQSREWATQERAWDAAKLDSQPKVYPYQIAFNVLPQVDSFLDTGYTKEEMKMENEGRKIMHHPDFRASVTCVRVPVFRAHSVAVTAQFDKAISVEAARAVLAKAPGLDIIDEPAARKYPLPLDIAGKDNCAVGRLRMDCALENALSFWVVGDQLLKGAALNAVQIAECLL
jgi:aspartate-semialdehyde dehydrogenase